jgi:hypothetical protein
MTMMTASPRARAVLAKAMMTMMMIMVARANPARESAALARRRTTMMTARANLAQGQGWLWQGR